jgi:hypothetical protein
MSGAGVPWRAGRGRLATPNVAFWAERRVQRRHADAADASAQGVLGVPGRSDRAVCSAAIPQTS